jgi:predicted nucleotidyltransferase
MMDCTTEILERATVDTIMSEIICRARLVSILAVGQHKSIANLYRRHVVRELALFGSILRDDFNGSSDLDVAVSLGTPKGESLARQYFDLKQELETLFARSVDLVELEAMPDTRLKRIIERTKVPIYGA